MATVRGQIVSQLQINLGIRENRCISFSLTNYANENKNKIPFEGFEFSFNSNFALLENEKSFRVILTTTLKDRNSPNKPDLAELIVFNKFFIANYDEIIKKDNKLNVPLIPNALIGLCNEVTLGIARGMLSVKLENTLYSEAIIPLINPQLLSPPPPKK